MSTLFVDRGGTSTKVWEDVRPRSLKRFPSDLPKLLPQLKNFIRSLPEKPAAALVGSRGVWTKAERRHLQQKLSFLAKKVDVVSDIELAHTLAFGKEPGIVLNAGTGSIALGRNTKGKVTRAGGLGPVLGDEGSAFWIGREYIKATKDISFLRKLTKDKDGVRKIAAHAMTVLKNNSVVARKIQEEAAKHLVDLITDVQSTLKMKKPTPVILRGGLFNNAAFRTKVTRRLRTSRFHV